MRYVVDRKNKSIGSVMQSLEYQWKWSAGEAPERTPRMQAQTDAEPSTEGANGASAGAANRDLAEYDHAQVKASFFGIEQQQVMRKTTRDEVNAKLETREMIPGGGWNPFRTSNSYVDDLAVQNQFLMPK